MRLFKEYAHIFQFQVSFTRALLENDISAWKNKRMTGFHAEWHLEDKNGSYMNVSQPPIFTWGRNQFFREFISMVNSSISSGRMTAESAMKRLKDLKKEWILRNRREMNKKCTNYDVSNSTILFHEKKGLALKIQELEHIISEYSYEIGYWDNATEIREGKFKIIGLVIYYTIQHYFIVLRVSAVFSCQTYDYLPLNPHNT